MKKSLLLLAFVALLALGSCSKNDDSAPPPPPSNGKILSPFVGGSTEPNQVYVSLSTEKMDPVRRDLWDFGFSGGSEFRVILNESIKMSAKKLETTDMSVVQVKDPTMVVGHADVVITSGFVDNPNGVLTGAGKGLGTAIAEVSATDADNKVYLVNLGVTIPTTAADKGSVNTDGDERGWKKIRILRDGTTGYKIQYANLDSPTFTTKIIAKDPNFNFSFLSVATGLPVTVEPQKTKWDLCFTTIINYLDPSVYPMSDIVLTNMKGGTWVYQVLTKDDGTYADFTKAKVKEDSFKVSATNQMVIGSGWRSVIGSAKGVKADRFYVVKDAAGNYYKLIFRAMQNEARERGNPTFEYALLK